MAGENKPLNSVPTTLAEAKQRLQRIQEAAIQQAQQAQQGGSGHPSGQSVSSKPTLELKPLTFSIKPAAASGTAAPAPGASGSMARFGQQGAAGGPASGSTARAGSAEAPGPQTYEISPYK